MQTPTKRKTNPAPKPAPLSAEEQAQEKRRWREQFEREKAERDRALEAQRRHMFTQFKMWTVCPDKRCIHAQACRGDPA